MRRGGRYHMLRFGAMSNPEDGPTPEEGLAIALRLLRARDKSEAQVAESLRQRGFDERNVTEILARLTRLGYLDDSRVAAARARKLLHTGYALEAVDRRLQALGIDDAV